MIPKGESACSDVELRPVDAAFAQSVRARGVLPSTSFEPFLASCTATHRVLSIGAKASP